MSDGCEALLIIAKLCGIGLLAACIGTVRYFASWLDRLKTDEERSVFKLVELMSGMLVVVALHFSKTFPEYDVWLWVAYWVVCFNAVAVVLSAWAGARMNNAIHGHRMTTGRALRVLVEVLSRGHEDDVDPGGPAIWGKFLAGEVR